MITIKRSTSRVSGGGGTGSQRTTNSQQPTKTMTKCGKCCYYFRQVITFLFSHIGLGTLLLGYALMGAFTFQALESDHEEQQREEMRLTRDKMIRELSEMTNRSSILKYENWTSMAEEILRKFEMKFLDAVKHRGYDGNEELAKTTSQWSFSGALLYSIIVITTIGYGNVAPRTHWGKIVTILYAIIGIPLMLFCLSNIGHTMAHSFKFIYWKCCCYLCVKPKKAQRKRRRRIRRKIRKHRRNQRNAAMKLRMQPIGGNHLPNLNNLKHSHSFNHVNSNLAIAASNSFMDLEQQPKRNLSQSPSQRSTIINQHQIMDGNNNAQFTYGTDSASSAFTSVNATPIRRSFAMDPIAIISQQIQNNSNDNNNEYSAINNNQLQIPSIQKKQPILARSLSARYHNELSKNRKKLQQQQPALASYSKQQQQNKLQKLSSSMMKNSHQNQQQILMKPYRKTTMNVPPVICNKYASNSDEYIDIVYQFDPEETQRQLKYAQQQQSTVRFHPNKSYSSLVVPEMQRQSSPIPGKYSSSSFNAHNLNQYRRSISVIEPPPHPLPMLNVQQSQQQLQPPSFEMMNLNNHRQFGHYSNYGGSGHTFPFENNNAPINDISDLSESSDSDYSEDSDIQEKNIPITVCLALVISYICGGAWFFSASEEWTFLDASYFCFITLSTIGFGDLVPGRTVLSTHLDDGQMTLAICALYLLFGMALLAMSLNLVKEKVLETVRIIGERIGILVNDEDDENY